MATPRLDVSHYGTAATMVRWSKTGIIPSLSCPDRAACRMALKPSAAPTKAACHLRPRRTAAGPVVVPGQIPVVDMSKVEVLTTEISRQSQLRQFQKPEGQLACSVSV
jgi:hypothetical protein